MLISILAATLIMALPPAVTNPEWLRRPTPDEVQSRYPSKASKDWVEGKVVLQCVVLVTGKLDRCTVLSEAPVDYDFAGGALSLSRLIEMRPGTVDGVAEESLVNIPIEFRLPITNMQRPDMAGTMRCYGMISAHARKLPKDKLLRGALAEVVRRVKLLAMFTPWTPDDLQARLVIAEADGARAWQDGFNDDHCLLVFSP